MTATDWKFDFESLPRWDNRERIPFVYDAFFDIPQNDALCCIYSIVEVSMCNPEGFLAILKNKNKPELLINIASGFNFCPNFSVNSTGDLLFLLPSIYDKDTQTVLRPILVIDIFRNAFSYIPTNNHNPCFKVVEIKENIFKIDADERQMKSDRRLKTLSRKKIRINRLKWYDLSNLHSLPDMLLRKNAFCSCCSKKETTH